MANIHVKREIKIERNPVETFLMALKDRYRKNKKAAQYSFIAFIAFITLLIILVIVVNISAEESRNKFDVLVAEYNKYSAEKNLEKQKETVVKIENLSSDALFGFVSRMGFYYTGLYYHETGDMDKAVSNLNRFISKSKKDIFWELASMRVAVIYEDQGKADMALEAYKKLEADHKEGAVLDQLYFYMGNLYTSLKDPINARNYYNKVITEFPQSAFSARAKKRLFMLGFYIEDNVSINK